MSLPSAIVAHGNREASIIFRTRVASILNSRNRLRYDLVPAGPNHFAGEPFP